MFRLRTIFLTQRAFLAGWSVVEIAHELVDAPEIVRAGLGIIREQWTVGGTPAAVT